MRALTTIFLFTQFILNTLGTIAQDVIIKVSGDKIYCTIISVNDKQLVYKTETDSRTQYIGRYFVKEIIQSSKAEFTAKAAAKEDTFGIENVIDVEKNLESKEILVNRKILDIDTCDNIIFRGGEEVSSKIVTVTSNEIKYRKCPNATGPIYSVLKSTVFMIKYSNGNKDIIPAQDIILTTDGNKIKCIILSITDKQVIYKVEDVSHTQYIGKDFVKEIVQDSKNSIR